MGRVMDDLLALIAFLCFVGNQDGAAFWLMLLAWWLKEPKR